jgi:serine phosphatase RsbU (regulator of sigma subunit)
MFLIYMSIIGITTFFIIFGYINQLNLYEVKEYEKLQALASSLAINVDGDIHNKLMEDHPWKDDIVSTDENPQYLEIHSMLRKAQNKNNLNTALYTIVYNSDEEIFYYGIRSDTNVYFRHQYEMFPEILLEKMNEGGTIPRYRTENGEWLSAFFPITDSNNKTVGLLEADVEFGHFREMVFNQYKAQALISLVVILLMALLLIPYARRILREEDKITQSIVEQNRVIALKNRDITDSINYARRIQESLLPHTEQIQDALPNSFVYYKPRDIVSGDFYWFKEIDGKLLLSAVDCTGHGVPGALMSMIGFSKLNEISHKNNADPGYILEKLDEGVREALSTKRYNHESKDGMDMALCSFDLKNKKVQYSGAFRPLIKINGENIEETKGNRYPIGGGSSYIKNGFTTHEFDINKGDCFYMFSDGFPDQFGGPKDKKFMNKKFKALLQEIQSLSPKEQIFRLDTELGNWRGETDQVDDILVIGVCF